jgi:hypothetical protein
VGGGRQTALQLIDVRNLKPIAPTGVIVWPVCGPHSRPHRQSANTAHTINAYSHNETLGFIQAYEHAREI